MKLTKENKSQLAQVTGAFVGVLTAVSVLPDDGQINVVKAAAKGLNAAIGKDDPMPLCKTETIADAKHFLQELCYWCLRRLEEGKETKDVVQRL